jgi:hypothetical protein
LPSSASAICVSLGCGTCLSRPQADIIMPGVQKPHCRPWQAMKASCSGCSVSPRARPSTVVTARPCACSASRLQLFTARTVEQHGAGAALRGVAALVRAGQAERPAQQSISKVVGATSVSTDLPLT